MNFEELKKYMSAVFDMELNIYIQENTLKRMTNTYNSLGYYKKIHKPYNGKANTDFFGTMCMVGGISTIIIGIIVAIVEFVTSSGFFSTIFNVVGGGILYGVIGGVACGLIIGPIVAAIEKSSIQHKLDEDYQRDSKQYDENIKNDNIRVKNELIQKQALGKEIEKLKDRLNQSVNNLNVMYSYGILNRDYQNIYAVSSIYEYLEKGRTKSLAFNEATGDQGAYNIYENERRMDLIITNTQEILNSLDTVINNQYELATGLRNAQYKINSLCSGVNNFISSTANSLESIKECQSITAYNSERTARELEFMNWMHIFK